MCATPSAPPTRAVVLKFGGTSVASPECWQTIERLVRERRAEGLRPIVVASALAGVSNELEGLLAAAVAGRHGAVLRRVEERHRALAAGLGLDAEVTLAAEFDALRRIARGAALTHDPSPALQARVLAMGELMSTRLGSAWLRARGLAAVWLDARALLLAAAPPGAGERRRWLAAACDDGPDPALAARLRDAGGDLVVTQGFIAGDGQGHTVLLGRGGSDTSAGVIAARIGAERCEIWTDVAGLYTVDPRLVPSAHLLRHLAYDEAFEIATSGAKVLHPGCLPPLARAGIPLHVRCLARPEAEGTVVSAAAGDAGAQVKAISVKKGVLLVSLATPRMWQEAGFLAAAFAVFGRHGLSVDLVSTSQTNVTVSLDTAVQALDGDALAEVERELSGLGRVTTIGPTAVVSLVGRRIRSLLHLLGPALQAFEDERIHLVSQAADDLSFTFVVDEPQAERLARTLHEQLFGHRPPDALLGPSWQELPARERPTPSPPGASAWWRARRAELLALAAERTPLYVYDRPALDAAARDLLALQAIDRVFYAVKANFHPDVLRVFHDLGLGFECVSPGELAHIFRLFPGIDPQRVLFTPNFAPRAEYGEALGRGVHVTLDNLHPLAAWPDLFRGREVLVRLDPGEGRGHHAHVRTAGAVSKFGVSPAQLDRLTDLVAAAGARVTGLHAHTGSGILTPDAWEQTARFLGGVAARFPEVRRLDLGGGLGIPERPGQTKLDLVAVDEGLQGVRGALPAGVELWLEPGRYLVATAGVLLARVTQTKDKGPTRYVGVDAGMNTLLRPALYGAWHEIVNLTRLDEPPAEEVNVVGPICESGDTLGYERRLPTCQEGDVLLIATAGAYGRAMSSQYNLRLPAAEVLLT
jgi:diaminopimelate decarboxylase/aspartate kinase